MGNHGAPLESDRAINIIAMGDRQVFPGLVDHNGGDILDTDSSAGASATLKAPEVNVIAQGNVGTASNALEVEVGAGGQANFVTGASNAFINTLPGGESVNNIVDTSTVLAAYQARGFFLGELNLGPNHRSNDNTSHILMSLALDPNCTYEITLTPEPRREGQRAMTKKPAAASEAAVLT